MSIYDSLKELPKNQVIEIFRNKDGNKILLEIMEKWEKTKLWDKFYYILIGLEPTRVYHDRWGGALGSRSSTLVSRNVHFPEPKNLMNKSMKLS